MFKFELKKLYKSKIVLLTIIFSFFMALFTNYRSNNILQLSTEYPAYDGISGDGVFISMLDTQSYNFNNRSELMSSYHNSVGLRTRNGYSKIREFISHMKEHSFEEMYEVAALVQKLDYQFFQDLKYYVNKYPFKFINDNDRKTFEYAILQSEYYHDNDILFTDIEELMSTNYARRIVYNSKIIFGIPYLILIILCFHGILSKEKDDGTINLLKTQPKNTRYLFLSKVMTIVLNSIIYTISFLFFFFIICIVQGIKVGEFRDIFRIYNRGDELLYIKAYELIPLIILSFLIITFLFASIIIFINVISKNKSVSISLLIVLLGLSYTLTENVELFQVIYNPFYALDHIRSIIGTPKEIVKVDGTLLYQIIYENGIFHLFIFLVMSFVILEIAIKLFDNNKYLYYKVNSISKFQNNLLTFEIRKILLDTSFKIYILGTLVFILCISIFNINANNHKLNFHIENNGDLKFSRERIKQLKLDLEHADEANAVFVKQLLEEERKMYDIKQNINHAFKNNDSDNFYKYICLRDNIYYDKFAPEQYEILKNGKFTILSKFETLLLDKTSLEENISPVYRPQIKLSEYENYTTKLIEKEFSNYYIYLTNSSIYSNYRLLKYQNLDILVLILLIFMIVHGYISEKETSRNLEILYTQPISRTKYHISKIISQLIIATGIYIFITLFIFLIGIIVEGFGEYRQPIIEYVNLIDNSDVLTLSDIPSVINTIPIYIYLIRVFVAIVLQAFLLISISTLVSIFIKNKIFMNIIVGSIFFIGNSITRFIDLNFVKLLNPFTYIFASQVADNSVMVSNKIVGANYTTSILVLLTWSIIISLVGSILVKKIDQKY